MDSSQDNTEAVKVGSQVHSSVASLYQPVALQGNTSSYAATGLQHNTGESTKRLMRSV